MKIKAVGDSMVEKCNMYSYWLATLKEIA